MTTIERTADRSNSFVVSLFGAIARSVRAAAARRAQRLALADLLRLDPTRLDDLGINQQDVIEALSAPPQAGSTLARRREERANRALVQATA